MGTFPPGVSGEDVGFSPLGVVVAPPTTTSVDGFFVMFPNLVRGAIPKIPKKTIESTMSPMKSTVIIRRIASSIPVYYDTLVRSGGIEPPSQPWQGRILPLNHDRISISCRRGTRRSFHIRNTDGPFESVVPHSPFITGCLKRSGEEN